jgi:hypothetical protein
MIAPTDLKPGDLVRSGANRYRVVWRVVSVRRNAATNSGWSVDLALVDGGKSGQHANMRKGAGSTHDLGHLVRDGEQP